MPSGFQTTEGFEARVLEGRALADAGDFSAAEAYFRRLLEESRSGHIGNYARALGSLITLYGRAGRFLEAFVLAQRLAQLARPAGPDTARSLGFALAATSGALSQLHVFEPLADVLLELRSVLDTYPAADPGRELEYHSAAATYAMAQGDSALASHHIAAYREIIQGTEGMEAVFRWARLMQEAQLALHEGELEVARRRLTKLEESGDTPAFNRLKEVACWLQVHAAQGERDEARRRAGEALTILESVRDEQELASGCIHFGNRAAQALEELGEVDLARQVHDLIAAAVMIRIRQLDECMRDLPELGLNEAEHAGVLATFRKKFLDEQQALLKRVARLLESEGDEYLQAILANSAASGYVAICAWCERVRPSEGRWLPIGHFLPRDGSLLVTHGICPPCAGGLCAQSA